MLQARPLLSLGMYSPEASLTLEKGLASCGCAGGQASEIAYVPRHYPTTSVPRLSEALDSSPLTYLVHWLLYSVSAEEYFCCATV